MITELSILLPCYNNTCYALVAALAAQAEAAEGLGYEIIVADDGSTDKAATAGNDRINRLPHCRYVTRGFNSGRAAIRNYLAREARYPRLLFIDSDMGPGGADFITNYLRLDAADVAYGGYVVGPEPTGPGRNLRYAYERKYHRNACAAERRLRPYDDFHTSNFMIRRSIMLAHPLDERFRRYGYEDVIFGKTLRQAGITIEHVDNPLVFADFETNAAFMAKTEDGLATLNAFAAELGGYSSLVDLRARLRRTGLLPLLRIVRAAAARPIKTKLTGNKPSVLLFNIYKLLTFCGMS